VEKQTIVITGANRGIGRAAAEELAKDGHRVIMACRNTADASETAGRIRAKTGNDRIDVLTLDLASFASVRAFAAELAARGVVIDTLINNAGVLCDRYRQTSDGFETTLQVNYLSQFLLTISLLPHIADGRGNIVNLSSLVYRIGRVDERLFNGRRRRFDRFQAYADSKLAFLLFTLELADRLTARGIAVNSADPGIVDTNIITMHSFIDPLTDLLFRPFIRDERQGAEAAIRLASANGIGRDTGRYFVRRGEIRLAKRIRNHPFRKELWERTTRMVGL
jgi:NAD(P)-dependent dehydrogenase (short-subunit alcohol dehydrogenase family)